MSKKILPTDKLYQMYPKLNEAIENAEDAYYKSTNASSTAAAASAKADSVQEQFNQVVIEGDSSVEAAQARVNGTGATFTTLKARLDSSDSQIGITEKEIKKINAANAPQRLVLPSAYGDYEAFHPKMVSFQSAWNGYLHWLVFTPYPNGDQAKENPHLLASNDLINWVEPTGFSNPLEPQPAGTPDKQYQSDTHILYNSVANRLEVFWRYVDDDLNRVIIYRKTSTNGASWSSKEVVIQSNDRTAQDYVSPAIIHEDGKYKMWFVAKGYKVWYTESTTGTSWSTPVEKVIPYDTPMNNWHLDVIHTDVGYELFVTAFATGQDRNTMTLFHSVSSNNNTYSKANPLLTPSTQENKWDNMGIYRAGVTKYQGKYYILYSAVSKKWERGTGLTVGEELTHLKGLEQTYLPSFEASQVIARRTLTIGMTTSGQDYKVFFDVESLDIRSEFASSVFKPKQTGLYLITGYFVFSTMAENNTYVKLYEDGVYRRALGGGTNQQVFNISRLVYLKAGKSYDFYVSQTSGSSKTVNDSNLEITRIA